MSLIITSIESPSTDRVRATYDLQHWTQGRDGTCLSEPLILDIDSSGKTQISLNISDCTADSPSAALERLSTWLRRLADGIDEHKTSITLPL